jgi:STE24 endopeptidase
VPTIPFMVSAALGAPQATFDPVAETARLLATLPADQRLRSNAYFEGGYWLPLWGTLITIVITYLLYRTGLAVRMRNLSERVFRRRVLQSALFVALFVPLLWLLELPWDFYTGFLREHQYGLSNQTAAAWLGESALALVPALVILTPVVSLLYLAVRRRPKRWWIIASAGTPVVMLLVLLISPVFIEPMFNTYTPLTDPEIRDPILSLARANGVPVDKVFEVDASKQTTRISANVSGAFKTVRVALNDNLLNRCSPAEIKAVMAHELGHYVLNHVYKLTVYLSLLVAAGFAFIHWGYGAVRRRWGTTWGLGGIDDVAGLPLLFALLSVFFLLATPVSNTIVRTTESEADIFGINASAEPDGFAAVALKMVEYRKLEPGRWERILFYDHPSGYDRILMAMTWKAEHLKAGAPHE